VPAAVTTVSQHLPARLTTGDSTTAAGQSYKEIRQNLFLSLNTVEFHIKSIYRKLSVDKRVQAIEKAREKKLICA
jgi:DNA-binding CsgD family transcriptional regulator